MQTAESLPDIFHFVLYLESGHAIGDCIIWEVVSRFIDDSAFLRMRYHLPLFPSTCTSIPLMTYLTGVVLHLLQSSLYG